MAHQHQLSRAQAVCSPVAAVMHVFWGDNRSLFCVCIKRIYIFDCEGLLAVRANFPEITLPCNSS